MAYGLIHRLRVDSGIEAIVNVQANPGVTVTLIGSDKTTMFTAVSDSTTGLAAITVNIPDTYTIGTDISSDSFAEGNTTSIDISESKTYTAQFIKLNKGYTECGCTNAYKSNSLLVWWNGTKPTEYFSGWHCIDTNDNSETTGEGEVYQISSSISYRGFLKDVASGTTKTYKVGAYVTINGKNYYSAADTVTGTAKTISLNSFVKYTSSQTITVPEGCHSITAYCVGGGGGGGNIKNTGYWLARRYEGGNDYGHVATGGTGGGGGNNASKTIACIPGQNISIVVGNGGAVNGNGGTTSVTVDGNACSANGGTSGGNQTQNNVYGGTSYPALNQISGGSPRGGNGRFGDGANGGDGPIVLNNTRYGGGGGSASGYKYNPYTGSSDNDNGGKGGSGGGGNAWGARNKLAATAGTANSGGGGGGDYGVNSGTSHTNAQRSAKPGGSGVAFITFNA